MKTYSEFKEAIRKRESSNNYKAKNTLGYLGAYQFGRARLTDLGICRRLEGRTGYSNSAFEFVPPMTEEIFLSSKEAQDEAFDRHVADLKRRVIKVYGSLEFKAGNLVFGLSGAIAVCHLLGMGGLSKMLKGIEQADGYGTKPEEYAALFDGYVISV